MVTKVEYISSKSSTAALAAVTRRLADGKRKRGRSTWRDTAQDDIRVHGETWENASFWPPTGRDGCVSMPAVPLGLEELRSKVGKPSTLTLTCALMTYTE